MRRQDIRLILVGSTAAFVLSGCVTVEFRDPPVESETVAETGDKIDLEDPAAADVLGFTDYADADSFLPENLERNAQTARPQPDEKPKFELATWDRNPSRAISKAKALKRPLMLLFTGLSWNENAYKLSHEVFLTKTFNEFASEHLILSFLDYPQSLIDAPDSMRAMKEKYKVHGYPTLLLLDPNGLEIYRRSGYRPGRARDYFNELRLAVLEARGIEITVQSERAGIDDAVSEGRD